MRNDAQHRRAQDAHQRLVGMAGGDDTRAIMRTRDQAHQAAAELDPRLTPDAQRQQRQQARQNADRAAGQALGQVEQQADMQATIAGQWAAQPGPARNDTATMLAEQRADRGWQRLAQRLEAAPQSHRATIADADLDELEGALANLPTWGAARSRRRSPDEGGGITGPDVDGLLDLADRRRAVLTDGERGDRLRMAHDVADARALVTADVAGARQAITDPSRRLAGTRAARAEADRVARVRAEAGQDDTPGRQGQGQQSTQGAGMDTQGALEVIRQAVNARQNGGTMPSTADADAALDVMGRELARRAA